MRTRSTFVVAAALAVLAGPVAASAAPTVVPYLGYLTYASGGAVDGLVDVTVEIRSAPTAGDLLWGPYAYSDVEVSGGLFTVMLGGSGSPDLAGALDSGQPLWLDFAIDAQALAPRQQILTVPFARRAEDAAHLGGQPASAYATLAALPNAALSGSFNDLVDVPANLVTGSGASGVVPAFDGSSSLGSSPLSHESGRVGVGVASPLAALHVAGGLQIGMDSGACTAARAGSIRWTGTAVEFCDGTNWTGFGTQIGLGDFAGNPGLSCYHIKQQNTAATDGLYWLDPTSSGSAFQAYCDMANGGWTLVARMTVASGQAHYNTGAVGVSGTSGVGYNNPTTQKFADSRINAIRTNSPYSGSTAYRMTCWEGMGNFQTMYCSASCNFNATASVNTSECSRCAGSFEGSLVQFSPNTGTRGLGHHHDGTYAWSMAYQRHPEEGNNSGCRSDAKGGGDGHLWIR